MIQISEGLNIALGISLFKKCRTFASLNSEECGSSSRTRPDGTARTHKINNIRFPVISKACQSIIQYIINEKGSGLLDARTV